MNSIGTAAKAAYRNWFRPRVLSGLLAVALVIGGGVYLDRQAAILNEQNLRASVRDQVSLIRAKLEGNINANIQLVRGLVSTIATEPDLDQPRFDALAQNLFAGDSQLRSVAVAPDLVISLMYPVAGNEKAIGLDYRYMPAQRTSVFAARATGQLVLVGPVDLVQGGQGFIARFPVFLRDAEPQRFWGIVSAVIDIDRLYADSGLRDPNLTIDISITDQSLTAQSPGPFFGTVLSGHPVRAEVVLPPGRWQISAQPKSGWERDPLQVWLLRLAIVIGGALILLPIGIAGRLSAERRRHYDELQRREAQLDSVSRRLGLALNTSQIGIWEMDMVTNQLVWDDRMYELYGLPIATARRYVTWNSALHPQDRAQAEAEFGEGLRTGRYQSVFRICRPDGQIRTIKSIGAVYEDPLSNRKIVGVNWDITADMALTEELKRSTALTEARNVELEAARVSIEYNALHDSLTGLPNRRYLDTVLKQHAAAGFDETGSIALLHIDLDRFKQINDTLGHAAGDAMLIHVADVLRASCRQDDFVARIGGDEFVIACSAVAGNLFLATLAERLILRMREPVDYKNHQCRIGVSIGIATEYAPDIDVGRLLINADIALYRAKSHGRNRLEFFSEQLQAEVTNTKRVADEILDGLEREEFIAYYQPQFDAKTYDLVGVEALARWRHPVLGICTPDSFLAIAADLNVVSTLDRIMLEQAMADLERWDDLGLNVPRASVNVSHRRLHDPGLIAGLKLLNLAPGRLAFELVESIYLDDTDAMVAWNIDQIKDLGIDVEIDDFGTGYASIVSLQKLRPARLKIDRQLVDPIIKDAAQRQLLSSIVDIGKSMGIEVVAEGVETMEHAAILRDLGCDILQGYAFARPMNRTDLEAFLLNESWREAV